MPIEYLNVNGELILHTIVPIRRDGTNLFRALSYVICDTPDYHESVRALIVEHVVANWQEFSMMSLNRQGENYSSAAKYFSEMSRPYIYGGRCELKAAGQVFELVFEVYFNGELFDESFGIEGRPVRKLRFTQCLTGSYFEAYYPDEPYNFHIPKAVTLRVKCRTRPTRFQLREESRKYARLNNPKRRMAQTSSVKHTRSYEAKNSGSLQPLHVWEMVKLESAADEVVYEAADSTVIVPDSTIACSDLELKEEVDAAEDSRATQSFSNDLHTSAFSSAASSYDSKK